ncbi:hypothetical protein ABVT39_010588 [Epinephelus coioides]
MSERESPVQSEGEKEREREHQPSEDKLARSRACRKSSARQQCSRSAGFEATEAAELVADYNDCHNSTKHDH